MIPNAPCTTPSKEHGRCQLFRTCQDLVKLSKKVPFTTDDREFINKSLCLTQNNKVFVCCPVSCQLSENVEGYCVKPINCPEFLKLYQKTPHPPETLHFFRESHKKCKNINSPAVCCAKSQQTEKISWPTHCGIDDSDKIFGGSETRINEFRWTALMVYESSNVK